MTFDLRRALRRIKPHRFTQPLRPRPREALPFVTGEPRPGGALLLDTCVYIDVLQGRTPDAVDTLLRLRTAAHLSVCVGELAHCFGRLDPGRPGTAAILEVFEETIAAIPPHRLETAAESVVIEAGILAGLLFRLGTYQPGQEVAAMNDATIYLHALVNGLTVLTRNVQDFDAMNQVLPEGPVLFYDVVHEAVTTEVARASR